jgi:PKD repeat protein
MQGAQVDFRRSIGVMAASGLMLAMGCSGRDSDGVLQPAEPAQNSEQYAGMLPELPQDAPLPRSGQVASLIGLDGDEAVAEYLGQPDSTTHLMVLPSLAQRAGWAMYRFDGLALSDAPASLTVELQTPLPTGLYLGVADYGSGRWEITPVGSPQLSQTFGVPQSGDVISPAGSLYCVLFTYGGQTARIRRLTLAVDAPAPPPLGLAASENHSDRVRLTWTDQALSYDPDGAGPGQFEYVGTEIHRSFSTAGPWVKIAQVPNGTTSYDDADGEHNPLPYDEPVYYRLHTRLIGLTGPASGADEGRRVILPPTSLEASDGLYWDRIELRWPAVEGAQLYRLYYKLTGDPGDDFDELLETEETSFMHSFLDPAGMGCTYDTVYSYAVAVIVDGEEGQWLTDEGHCVVQAPVNFNATDGTEDGKVILTWDAADGAVAYDIEFRKAEETDADFRTIFLTGPPYEYTSETTFEHTLTEPEANPLEPNTTYVYRVRSRAWLSQWLYSYDWSTPDEGHARETLEARFTATPPDGPAPLTVQFDATQSIAPQGGSITLYEWDFEGDGVVDFSGASADTISHQYLQQGLLNPTLTVHGTSGGTHSASFRLPVGGWIHTAGLDLAEQASCVSVDPAGGIYAAGHGQTMGGHRTATSTWRATPLQASLSGPAWLKRRTAVLSMACWH